MVTSTSLSKVNVEVENRQPSKITNGVKQQPHELFLPFFLESYTFYPYKMHGSIQISEFKLGMTMFVKTLHLCALANLSLYCCLILGS